MFASSSLAILISAATAMASTHQAARNHHEIAKRLDNTTSPLDKRAQFTNQEFTWYPTDTGPDACTGKNHQDSDFYVAMGYNQFGDGSACCGKQMSITVNGKTATATCVDECASCPAYGQLDFTKGLFQYFTGGDLDVGVIHGSWSFTDGSGGGSSGGGGGDDGDDGDDTPTTTKKTTTKHTTTSTHHTTTSTHIEAAVTTTHHTTTSTPKPSSSKKASSSAKPSSSAKSSSKVSSSSAKPSSSSSVIEPSSPALPSATPSATPNQGVANAGSGAGTSAGDSDTGANGISGAIGTGSGDDTSDAASLSFNKLFATVAVVAFVAAQAL